MKIITLRESFRKEKNKLKLSSERDFPDGFIYEGIVVSSF